MRECRAVGLTAGDYPFSTERTGIRSLAGDVRARCRQSFGRAARFYGAPHLKGPLRDKGVAGASTDEIVRSMNAEVNRALASGPVTEAFQKGGIASFSGTPEQFAAFLASEIERYAQVIRRANISIG